MLEFTGQETCLSRRKEWSNPVLAFLIKTLGTGSGMWKLVPIVSSVWWGGLEMCSWKSPKEGARRRVSLLIVTVILSAWIGSFMFISMLSLSQPSQEKDPSASILETRLQRLNVSVRCKRCSPSWVWKELWSKENRVQDSCLGHTASHRTKRKVQHPWLLALNLKFNNSSY